jgi:Zn-dependent metalloprotease
MLESLAESPDANMRRAALDSLQSSASVRTAREFIAAMPATLGMEAMRAPLVGAAKKNRMVYTQGGKNPPNSNLPGKLIRKEGQKAVKKDDAANEAYDFSGHTWDFYNKFHGRNSIDNKGLALVSSVHAGVRFNNAFWNGQQMVYGDGDGTVFQRFTRSMDVVGHELTHGVVQYSSALVYQGESGALNEHFADVFGVMIRQWKLALSQAREASWLVGADLVVAAPTRKAIRSMAAPGTAYQNDPYLGTDPQPRHYKDRYAGTGDNGGVHINSGIPNHSFFLACTSAGGKPWDKVGKVWYKVMHNLVPNSQMNHMAAECRAVAGQMYGATSVVAKSIDKAWTSVGL